MVLASILENVPRAKMLRVGLASTLSYLRLQEVFLWVALSPQQACILALGLGHTLGLGKRKEAVQALLLAVAVLQKQSVPSRW